MRRRLHELPGVVSESIGTTGAEIVATHVGTLCLIAAFAILAHHGGSLALVPVRGLDRGSLRVVAVLLFVGFGMKAGLMPLLLKPEAMPKRA